MSGASDRTLLGKARDSLAHKGPAGLARDVRDYLRWRLDRPEAPVSPAPPAQPLSNLELNVQEIRDLPEVLRSKPILVYAEATTRCNLRCFMCRLSFPETTRRLRDHMSLETFARVEPLLEPGSRLSLFGLGEPLLNPHFVEMLGRAKARGAFVGLNSNAMLLAEPIARAMVELEQDLLVISFSGGTRETYQRVITGANWDRVLGHLRRLNAIKAERASPGVPLELVKPVLQLQFTAMRDNVAELPLAVRLALDLRCAGLVAMPLTVVDPTLADQSLLDPNQGPLVERAFDEARAVAAAAPYPFDLQLPPLPEEGTGGTRRREDAKKGAQSSVLSPQSSVLSPQSSALVCHEPWQTLYVRDDGTVNTCCYSNRILGDLGARSALEIWNGEAYRRFRARMRSDDKPTECRVCHRLLGDDRYDQRVDEVTFYDEL